MKRIFYFILVVVIGLTGFFAGVVSERTGLGAGSFATEALKLKKLSDIIEKEYYFQDNFHKDEAFEHAMAGYVYQLKDPFSSYIYGKELDSFAEEVEGEYVGIGVEIMVDENNYITVINAFDGSPAQKAGIQTGDKIISVFGEAVNGDQLDEVVDKIRGLPGETVELEILSAKDEVKPLILTRSDISVETVRVRMIDDTIGYVRISSFDATTDREFSEKMKLFDDKDLKGLIVDLRSNSGGTLESVTAVADYLMGEGTIVTVKYTGGREAVEKSDAAHAVTVPICVLINEGTASAAELLAGGLRDNNGAVLIGMNTYGKGVVNQPFMIDSNSAVILTIGEYFLPCGDNIHQVGLKPDIEVKIENQTASVFVMPESSDTQLQRAIEELKS